MSDFRGTSYYQIRPLHTAPRGCQIKNQSANILGQMVYSKDLKNQDDCYRKFYLYAHEGHGEGWSKLHFWQIWCDSRGHSALESSALMTDSPKSMQVQIHLGPTFVFHSPSWVLIQPTAWNLWQSSIWAGLKLSSIYSSLISWELAFLNKYT